MFNSDALKEYLDSHGIKQAFLAQKIGVSENALSQMFAGRTKCKLVDYINICRALSVPFETFIEPEKTPA